MSLELIEDHIQQGLEKRISQYLEKPRLERWIAIYLKQVQLLEEEIWRVLIERGIDDAEGVTLDTLGRIVGQPRRGSDDDRYRVYLKARIQVNLSRGRYPELRELGRLLVPNPNPASLLNYFIFTEQHPAAYTAEVTYPIEAPEIVHELFQEASPAGVRFSLVWQEDVASAEHHAFIFGRETEVDTLSGFGTETGDTGGKLANEL